MAIAVRADVSASRVLDVVASVPPWWERRAEEAGLPPQWRDWRLALHPPPAPLSGAAVPDLLHADPFAIGEAYVCALAPRTRLAEGRHYTPAGLAHALWGEIRASAPMGGLVVDPACGAGALLLPPLRELVATADDPAAALREAPRRFAGSDLDAVAVWIGNALLGAELLPLWARLPEAQRGRLPRILHEGDGLACSLDRPSIVVMNPPYGRVQLPTEARERWRDTLFGHANRYGLFLHAAVERVAPGGLVAAVVPTSFLGGAYYQRLRAYLAREAPLTRLAFVDARAGVFVGDVLQETCLALFTKGSRPGAVACAQLALNGAAERMALAQVSFASTAGGRPWLLPRGPGDERLIEAAERLEARLPDYGWRASTGPLVWNRHKPQIFASAGPGRSPIVWAADLDRGRVRQDPARDQQRWIELRPADEFMQLEQSAILVQRTTAPEQPRRLVVAVLDIATLAAWGGAVVVENHVNVLRCTDLHSPLGLPLLARLLATPTLDRLYRCLTGTVAVSRYELEALPLPDAETLRRWHDLPPDQLTRAVAALYGDDAP